MFGATYGLMWLQPPAIAAMAGAEVSPRNEHKRAHAQGGPAESWQHVLYEQRYASSSRHQAVSTTLTHSNRQMA